MIVLRKGDRLISIDEYIEYLEQCADITKGSDEGDRLSRQHTQLAVWLKELKSQRWLLEDIQDTCEYLYLENIRYRSCLTDDAENARQILGESRELKAENAKLREQGARLFDKTLELATENAKLRELVRDLERARFALCMYEVVDAQCDDCSASPVCATLYGRMEELKIEVPHD